MTPIEKLVDIMKSLRTPETGCPWDIDQTFRSIAPYTVEEAYEVADAIERNDLSDLRSELGDLLFQVVFHARIAEEIGAFTFEDVVITLNDKMTRRHPHVFGDAGSRTSAEQVMDWERQKAAERNAKGAPGLLDDIPLALPALTRAVKLQKRAARVGFDWPDARQVLDKLSEEAGELVEAIDGADPDRIEDEFGDLMFVMANLSRHLALDPEAALRRTNQKFVDRFAFIERKLSELGRSPADASLQEMEALWQEAKSTNARNSD